MFYNETVPFFGSTHNLPDITAMNKGQILIVDDDEDVLHTARLILKKHYQSVLIESSPIRLETILSRQQIDVLLLDMNFKTGSTTGNEGIFWLQKVKAQFPETQVIMNTAYGDIQLAVESMKLGAVDFLVKPWEKEKLLATVNSVFQLAEKTREVNKLKQTEQVLTGDLASGYSQLCGASQVMQDLLKTVEKVAATDASVLILGENGTGKELLARQIHRQSARAIRPMVKVDLGALPANLFESEMFGHVKGAFTDAKEDRIGRFEMASGSTLFLDEIGNLEISLQAKLLSVLQNQEFSKVGSSIPLPTDVRLISATNQPLLRFIEGGKFRQDLLYRINTVELELPPLRERVEDIPLLIQYYLKQYSERYQKHGLKIADVEIRNLLKYSWPGNIRELQHAIERAVILVEKSVITADQILPVKRSQSINQGSLKVEDVEKSTMLKALEKHGGNMSKAADELGIGRTTLYRKLKKYGV